MQVSEFKEQVGKWSEPLHVITMILGSISFVTISYIKIENNREMIDNLSNQIEEVKKDNNHTDDDLREELSEQGKKLGKIEGKLDVIINMINRRRD